MRLKILSDEESENIFQDGKIRTTKNNREVVRDVKAEECRSDG